MTRRPSLRDRRRWAPLHDDRRAPLQRTVLTMPTRAVQQLMAFAHLHRICLWQAALAAMHNAVPGLVIEVEDEDEGGAR